jgi:hypothetical protein
MAAIVQDKPRVRQGSSPKNMNSGGCHADSGAREPHNIEADFRRMQFAPLVTIAEQDPQ